MAINEGNQKDTLPSQQYVWDGTKPVRVSASPNGNIITGIIPRYDTQVIDDTDPNNITITYSLGGVTVATKTIVTAGTITISVSIP